jgi:hypothetical protein
MKKVLFIIITSLSIVACKEADKNANTTTTGSNPADTANTAAQVAANVTTTPEPAVDSANLTTVEWIDSQDKDFGKIKEGQVLEVSFKFKNTGTKPLVISNVRAQCGCTIPETPKEPITPGATGVIKAAFNSSGRLGLNTKEVYMDANTDPGTSVLKFHVEVIKSRK